MPNEDEKRELDEAPAARAPEADEKDEKGVRARLEAFIPDLIKKTFYAGLGAVFTTEEGIRKIANEFSLPKDVATYLINSAQTTKDELFRIVGREMREFLQNVNLSQELQKLLTQLSFEIKTEIRFIPNEQAIGGVKPDIKRQVALKRTTPDEGAGEGGDGPKS
jgi:hypothetical protein